MKKNILVFPCGSEIALDIYSSVEYSTHFNLIGASSVEDHGSFVYENYISDIPFITDESFIPYMANVVASRIAKDWYVSTNRMTLKKPVKVKSTKRNNDESYSFIQENTTLCTSIQMVSHIDTYSDTNWFIYCPDQCCSFGQDRRCD